MSVNTYAIETDEQCRWLAAIADRTIARDSAAMRAFKDDALLCKIERIAHLVDEANDYCQEAATTLRAIVRAGAAARDKEEREADEQAEREKRQKEHDALAAKIEELANE